MMAPRLGKPAAVSPLRLIALFPDPPVTVSDRTVDADTAPPTPSTDAVNVAPFKVTFPVTLSTPSVTVSAPLLVTAKAPVADVKIDDTLR